MSFTNGGLSVEARRRQRCIKGLPQEGPRLREVVSGGYRWLLHLVLHIAQMVVSAGHILEDRIAIIRLHGTQALLSLLRVEACVGAGSRNLGPPQVVLRVVKARLSRIETWLGYVL